jgi:hypothetical protein
MNLARVEHYFAEVLSHIEDRTADKNGGFRSAPLFTKAPDSDDHIWGEVGLSPNLAIVGTVNMDESSHGFSRKVLDRAFTLELSGIDLTWAPSNSDSQTEPMAWSVADWYPRAIRLTGREAWSEDELALISSSVDTLKQANRVLVQAQLQVGYRTRDEVALFRIHAEELKSQFRTTDGQFVDPLDLVLEMKILPRIAGGSAPIRRVLCGLLTWTTKGAVNYDQDIADDICSEWASGGHLMALSGASYPRTAARLCLMWDRLRSDGFTSFWL